MKSALVACALALLVGGCERTPRLRPLAPDATVLAFGDSLTSGTGAGENESYPVRLAELIARPVINAGIPGEVTAEGLRRLPELLDRHQPALLLLCHGGNDLLQHSSEEQTAENLRTMIRLARERGIGVVLLGVPKPDLSFAPPPYYQQLALEFSLPYDGETLPEILSKRSSKSDLIHPNAAGYQRLAEAVSELLHEADAL